MTEESFHLGIKALIRNNKGQVLVLKKSSRKRSGLNPQHWDLPGGRMEKGDDIETTLKRELLEEIGISDIEIVEFFDASISKLRILSKKEGEEIVGLILFTYLCAVKNTRAVKITSDEHTELKWHSPKKAAKLLTIKFADSFVDKIKHL